MKLPSKPRFLYFLLISYGFLALGISSSAFEDPARSQEPFYQSEKIFSAGEGGYHSFRIPSLVTAKDGTLIAICEGRVRSRHDFGDIDIVAKRSSDNGTTWGRLEKILHEGQATFGNPTAVVEETTGVLFLFISSNPAKVGQFGDKPEISEDDGFDKIDEWGERRLIIMRSGSNGKNWSKPNDMTELLVPKQMTWDAVGPGNGIQIIEGPHKGRLVVPAIGRNIISDDMGKSWSLQMLPSGTSESTIVEVGDGTLIRNDRATETNKEFKRRMVSVQQANGKWTPFKPAAELVDPVSHASLLRYTGDPERIIFLNAADGEKRSNMMMRLSYDGGKTWPVSRPLVETRDPKSIKYRNHGGYSAMTKTADRRIGILYEYNEDVRDAKSGRSIMFSKVNLGWLLERRK